MSQQQEHIDKINNMSQLEMANLWRNASSGHIYFDTSLPYHNVFNERFKALGGFTPAISKKVGWNVSLRQHSSTS